MADDNSADVGSGSRAIVIRRKSTRPRSTSASTRRPTSSIVVKMSSQAESQSVGAKVYRVSSPLAVSLVTVRPSASVRA